MTIKGSVLATVKKFCGLWFEDHDLQGLAPYLAEDIAFSGTGESESAQGKDNLLEYIRLDMEESHLPFAIEFGSGSEQLLNRETGIASLDFILKNQDYEWHIHGTFTLTRGTDAWQFRQIHFSVPTSMQKEGEHYPLTLVRDRIYEKQQYEKLIEAVQGGIGIFRFKEDGLDPVYLSSGIGVMVGMSREECLEIVRSIDNLIYPQDMEHVFFAIKKAVETLETVEITYRIKHIDGYYVWTTAIFKHIGMEDGLPLIHGIFLSASKQFELQEQILNGTTVGVCVVDAKTHELNLANNAMFTIMDTEPSDYAGKTCHDAFGENWAPCGRCLLHYGDNTPREIVLPVTGKILLVTVRKARWMGRDVIIEYLNDVTEQKEAQNQLFMSRRRLAAAIRHAGMQFWEYDMEKDRAYFHDFSGEGPHNPRILDDFPEVYIGNGKIHPDDADGIRAIHRDLKNGAGDIIWDYRFLQKDGEYHWMRIHYSNIFDGNGKPVLAIATEEAIDEYKELEERFLIAARQTGVLVWTLDIQNQTAEIFGGPLGTMEKNIMTLHATEEGILGTDLVFEADRTLVWEKYQELYSGADSVSFEARMKNFEGKYRWTKVFYTVIKARNGSSIKAIGTSMDIHEHVLLKARFEHEMQYSIELQAPNLVTKAHCNISKNILELQMSDNGDPVFSSGMSYDISVEQLADRIEDLQQRQKVLYMLSRNRILESFGRGENIFTLEYRRAITGKGSIWVKTIVKTFQNPATGDVMCFLYSYNIDDQKTAEAITAKVVDTNYEYLILLDAATGNVERSIYTKGAYLWPEEGVEYGSFLEHKMKQGFSVADRDSYMAQFALKTIVRMLEANGNYSLSCDYRDAQGDELRHKLWNFGWFDEEHTKIICSRSDITEIHRNEERQKDALASALAAAEQASAAKTEFLSRMSHEIRTPMNAIIGMTAIAVQSMGNEEQLAECISKIGISSRFLLALINDILDMSRIESGKVLLKNEKIPFEEFLNGLNAICYPQAETKNVDYECIIDPMLEDCYMGDSMKLQQVLINIVSNAIKFTGSGGKVTFSAYQRKKAADKAVLRFIINDTGIGMSKEFLTRIFEPFEQESTGTTAQYGGTGLGLAISKSLVDMMNGNIEVRSIKGVGTEFTVDVTVGVVEGERQNWKKKLQQYRLEDLKTLVVDDDIIVCESTSMMLKEIGIAAEWVDTGAKAVECVRMKWQKMLFYDMILIDWKMPGMDGIETTKRIREITGPDVTIIIMTAYDWSAIEYEARAAGVNMLMSKPLFKSSLISAFSRALGEKEEDVREEAPEDYDFTGKRLLLVEDHPMNTEIARMILEAKGFEIENAENGLRAIEMFSKSGEGYYDAILMDIRMPIMDGLQAARNIRHMSNKDAKTIPIIAMTANAFDDDVDKSRAAGMNAHLAKPIDPPTLYRTLADFLLRGETEG